MAGWIKCYIRKLQRLPLISNSLNPEWLGKGQFRVKSYSERTDF